MQAGIFLLFCLLLNTIWEINTINETDEDIKTAEPEIEDSKNKKIKGKMLFQLIVGLSLLSLG